MKIVMKKLFIYILFLLMSIYSLNAGAQGLSIFADLLVWHASEETASSWSSVITTPKSNVTIFSPKNIDFNWGRGFRGGFLYESECFWDTKLYWTYLPSKKSVNLSPADQIITPEFFSGFLSGNFFFGANIDWQLVMNTIDLEASHKFNISKSVSIRPSIGIKGGTINQNINAQWNALIYTARENLENNFFGVGPSFGINAKWNVYKTFNLVGDFSTALMWGNWKVNDTYKRPSISLGPIPIITPTTITTNMNDSKLGTIMFDYFIGLEWTHQGRSRVTLQLGYEMQYWANQLRLPTFQQLPLHGDLTLQGGTCGIYIDL